MPPRVILRLIGIRTLCRPRLSPMFQAHNQCLRGSHSQPSCCSDRSKAHPRNMHARRTKGDPRRPLCRGHSNNAHDSRAGPPTALRPAPYGSTAIFRLARTSQRKTWPHTRKRRSQRQSSLHLASSWCSPQMNFSAITRPQPDSGMLALDQRSREKAAGTQKPFRCPTVGGGCFPGLRLLSRVSPSTPSAMNRACHLHTTGLDLLERRMISAAPGRPLSARCRPQPSAVARMCWPATNASETRCDPRRSPQVDGDPLGWRSR